MLHAPEMSAVLRRRWYATWVFLPLLWLLPDMATETWPPQFASLALSIAGCSIGSVAAWRTIRTSPSPEMRVAAGILGSIYAFALVVSTAGNLWSLRFWLDS